jgi:hypothetical protein
MADRAQRRAADLADAFCHRIGHRQDLCGLIVEEQVIVAEMRTGHMPMEVLRLQIEGEHIGEQGCHRTGNIPGRVFRKA